MIRRQWSIVIAFVRMLLVLLLIKMMMMIVMMMDMVLKIHNDSGVVAVVIIVVHFRQLGSIIICRQQLKVCIIIRTVRTDGIHCEIVWWQLVQLFCFVLVCDRSALPWHGKAVDALPDGLRIFRTLALLGLYTHGTPGSSDSSVICAILQPLYP